MDSRNLAKFSAILDSQNQAFRLYSELEMMDNAGEQSEKLSAIKAKIQKISHPQMIEVVSKANSEETSLTPPIPYNGFTYEIRKALSIHTMKTLREWSEPKKKNTSGFTTFYVNGDFLEDNYRILKSYVNGLPPALRAAIHLRIVQQLEMEDVVEYPEEEITLEGGSARDIVKSYMSACEKACLKDIRKAAYGKKNSAVFRALGQLEKGGYIRNPWKGVYVLGGSRYDNTPREKGADDYHPMKDFLGLFSEAPNVSLSEVHMELTLLYGPDACKFTTHNAKLSGYVENSGSDWLRITEKGINQMKKHGINLKY
jgi:hypothetical protein